ncbi:hypothetical protein JAAARDRAFT_38291 [Jaapia argillacea MUCL 33604]|uniref:Uncharacterized protein n=1 Tax=Jaapia argillacea MUCL 33604 TaxID=933084 RepID=A0A067PTK2_9AGAM|nr:hypothetical protein JAAARDRAFT_38291 [Jaapia argillacea MUCL 33604]
MKPPTTFRGILSVLLLHGVLLNSIDKGGAQKSLAVCLTPSLLPQSMYSNSLHQDPCLVGAWLWGVCGGQVTIGAIKPGVTYMTPGQMGPNSCICSSVWYAVMAACTLCQNGTNVNWQTWVSGCATGEVSVGTFPYSIPAGLAVPAWAYVDVTKTGTFDLNNALELAKGPESTAVPSASATSSGSSNATSTASTSSTSTSTGVPSLPSVSSSSSSSSAPYIIAAAIGGVLALALGGWYWYRRRTRSGSSGGDYSRLGMPMNEQHFNFVVSQKVFGDDDETSMKSRKTPLKATESFELPDFSPTANAAPGASGPASPSVVSSPPPIHQPRASTPLTSPWSKYGAAASPRPSSFFASPTSNDFHEPDAYTYRDVEQGGHYADPTSPPAGMDVPGPSTPQSSARRFNMGFENPSSSVATPQLNSAPLDDAASIGSSHFSIISARPQSAQAPYSQGSSAPVATPGVPGLKYPSPPDTVPSDAEHDHDDYDANSIHPTFLSLNSRVR